MIDRYDSLSARSYRQAMHQAGEYYAPDDEYPGPSYDLRAFDADEPLSLDEDPDFASLVKVIEDELNKPCPDCYPWGCTTIEPGQPWPGTRFHGPNLEAVA